MTSHFSSDLLVILRHGPHGSSLLRDGLDAALVAAAFGQRVSLLFMGEGVMALVDDQQPDPLGQKGTSATIEMLSMYDIEAILVEQTALELFGLTPDELMLPVRLLTGATLSTLPTSHRLVLTF
ncbi:sulfurtransferase complex subunit TusC [Halomonas sp. TRM85114]|uniref:sulfurtransferase complex subunit TusC n=1 Tax=Halomonas jincaotanensis TaxID=2810616 RepID=UPI001BD3592E|nr:sulfurtransferase complex subunit TusC [Halomonas jincaotanensis]MBS9402536.1 sulfurtransferase complex subunit TusC [Halomonas jincaotanensis]